MVEMEKKKKGLSTALQMVEIVYKSKQKKNYK